MTETMENEIPALALKDITMSFGANRVLKGVSLTLRPGRITALLGANGAGKSTLIKILAGVYSRTNGTIEVAGRPVEIVTPNDAAAHGIQTVHQRIDENLVPGLTVAENLLFEEILRSDIPRVASVRSMLPKAREVASTLDLDWSDSKLRSDAFDLGIADGQLVLLARALSHRPKVLVLDEPTSTLSQAEANRLFDVIRHLRDQGVAILYVSHHMSEIKNLADELLVLRDGQILDRQTKPLDLQEAIRSMLGNSVLADAAAIEERRGESVALSLRGVQLLKRAQPFDLDLRRGEVTGIVGLVGAGKSELARACFGADKLLAGTMELDGKPFAPRHTSDAVRHGVYLMPEDRAQEAMFPGWSLARTISLPFIGKDSPMSVIRHPLERKRAQRVIDEFAVVATGPEQSVDSLSGGNQQKAVVGRWMQADPKVLLLDEPFRGVDIGARRVLSAKARECAERGACVIVLSSDVDEIREVADRVIVLVEGQVTLDAYTTQTSHGEIVRSMSEVPESV
ncbi:sugar ABC transporter ATP-binding protein [Acidipropionibacterium timonense]|uniref:sugar ABC transporter ATP-binding protein n=1 Tax=Acidipropionibacterium timonense TaxID=2161818 RepID=UPI001AEC0B9C|nr:sugar ABC transporter ATP-binding protein [Acidipropionibacterium timonense]